MITNVKVSFGNPLYMVLYSACLLTGGWAIGARWGHTSTSVRWLVAATAILLVHDIAIAIASVKVTTKLANRGQANLRR